MSKRAIGVLLMGVLAILSLGVGMTQAAAPAPAITETPAVTAGPVGEGVAGAEALHEGKGELIPVSETAMKQAFVQAVWVLVIFAILLAILYPTAWKGVLAGLKEREHHIRKDIDDAEAARIKAEETLKQYTRQLAAAEDRVREMFAKAQADGERIAATIHEAAVKEAEQTKTKALADIDEAGKQAVAQIHAQTAELATAIAEKIIRRNLNVDDQRELVRQSLAQLESAGRN